MRVDLRDARAPGISAVFAGAGVATTLGIAEFARAALAASTSPLDLQRGLLWVVAVYAPLGALAGGACWAAQRISAAPAAALALALALAAIGPDAGPIAGLAALALGILALRVGSLVLSLFPSLPRARLASTAALLAIAALCAAAARALPAYGPRWALGAAVAALGGAILVWAPRVRGSALLLASGSLFLVWQGAQHVQRLAPSVKPAAAAPSVLLVTISSLRADRVGAYGYAAANTPNLDAAAARGTRFDQAYVPSLDGTASQWALLSGRAPAPTGPNSTPAATADFRTLADTLAGAGYVTAAFPSRGEELAPLAGLLSRFQFVDADLRERTDIPKAALRCVAIRPLTRWLRGAERWHGDRPASATTDRALRFLASHAAAPVFAWVHYGDPHAPPEAPRSPGASGARGDWNALDAQERRAVAGDATKLAELRALYDQEVAAVDRELGRLLTAANESAPAGGLLVVVTSDRGEPMGEHGSFWAPDLYDTTLRVPLLVIPPPRLASAPNVVTAVVRSIDVAPTILDALGLPREANGDGSSLRGFLVGDATASGPDAAIALSEPGPAEFGARSAAVRQGEWKLIWRQSGMWLPNRWLEGSLALFNVATDPSETNDVSAAHTAVLWELAQRLPPGWKPEGLVAPAPTAERSASGAPAPAPAAKATEQERAKPAEPLR